MRKISKFRDVCLLSDVFLNKYYSTIESGKEEVDVEFIEREKIRLNVPEEPSLSNTLCINVIGQGIISEVDIVSIVKDFKPQKNYTKDVHCVTNSTMENKQNEVRVSINDSMDCQDDHDIFKYDVKLEDPFVTLEDNLEEDLPIETLKTRLDICRESSETCQKKTIKKEEDPYTKVILENEKDPNKKVTLKKEKDSNKKLTLKKEKDANKKVTSILKKEKDSKKKVASTFKKEEDSNIKVTTTLKKEKDPILNVELKKKNEPILNLELPVISEVEDAVCVSLTIEEQLKEKEDRAREEDFVNSVFKCELCVKVFKAKHVLDGHMEKHKESRGAYECCVCSQRFGSNQRLRRHGRRHSRYYECPVCSQRCWPRSAFREHVARHRGLESRCPVCQKCFTGRLTYLRTHMRVAHGTGPRYKCDTCGKVYDERYLFKLHILRHSGSPQHQCPECPKSFFTARILTKHMKKHAASHEYYCVQCDHHFPWHSSFLQHLKTSPVHRDPTLNALSSLLEYSDIHFLEYGNHVVKCYPTFKRFDCAHCALKFPSLARLQTHVRKNHAGAPSPGPSYSCEHCGRTFNTSTNLASHTRFMHEGFKLPRRFACTMCDKIFSAKNTLRDHIYTHTGERPFECCVCHNKFAQKSAMNRHIRKWHSNDAKPAAKRCYKKACKGENETHN